MNKDLKQKLKPLGKNMRDLKSQEGDAGTCSLSLTHCACVVKVQTRGLPLTTSKLSSLHGKMHCWNGAIDAADCHGWLFRFRCPSGEGDWPMSILEKGKLNLELREDFRLVSTSDSQSQGEVVLSSSWQKVKNSNLSQEGDKFKMKGNEQSDIG